MPFFAPWPVLGGHLTDQPASQPWQGQLKERLLKSILFGGSSGLGFAVIFYSYRLLEQKPSEGFGLLHHWGPWFVVALVALYFFWDVTKVAVGYVGKMADGMQSLSVSIAKIAERDDRQYEEMQRIGQYNARQNERELELLIRQGEQLGEIADQLRGLPCKTQECK